MKDVKTFTPDEKIVKILQNFSTINPSLLITPTELGVISNSKSVIAKYPFQTPFDFEPFGLYNAKDFLGILNAMSKPTVEVQEKFVSIVGQNSDRVKYFTTASELVPKVPNMDISHPDFTVIMKFNLSSDRLAVIKKMSAILKSKFIFFETDNKRIRITLGDELESSGNNYEVEISDDIKVNILESVLKIPTCDFNVLDGEYEITIVSKTVKGNTRTFTSWENLNGVSYIIATAV